MQICTSKRSNLRERDSHTARPGLADRTRSASCGPSAPKKPKPERKQTENRLEASRPAQYGMRQEQVKIDYVCNCIPFAGTIGLLVYLEITWDNLTLT